MVVLAGAQGGRRRDPTRIGEARPSHLVTTTGVGAIVDLPSMSVIVRGLDLEGSGTGRDLIRPAAEDLFR